MMTFPINVKLLSTPRFIEGGCSEGNFRNFNLAFHVKDKQSSVMANRELLNKHYNLPSDPKWINQTHSNICIDASSIFSSNKADASYSSKPGVVCGILTADCLPVFVTNSQGTIVGVAHAGWRGIVGGVIESLLESMNCKGDDLLVHLGPAISKSSYEVGEEVKSRYLSKNENFERSFLKDNGSYYLDIYDAAKVVLEDYGVKFISGGESCTYNDSNEFFSFRRDGINSGRMAHLIWFE
jgi:YfiH family protein